MSQDSHDAVAETAVVGFPHPVKGEGTVAETCVGGGGGGDLSRLGGQRAYLQVITKLHFACIHQKKKKAKTKGPSTLT